MHFALTHAYLIAGNTVSDIAKSRLSPRGCFSFSGIVRDGARQDWRTRPKKRKKGKPAFAELMKQVVITGCRPSSRLAFAALRMLVLLRWFERVRVEVGHSNGNAIAAL